MRDNPDINPGKTTARGDALDEYIQPAISFCQCISTSLTFGDKDACSGSACMLLILQPRFRQERWQRYHWKLFLFSFGSNPSSVLSSASSIPSQVSTLIQLSSPISEITLSPQHRAIVQH